MSYGPEGAFGASEILCPPGALLLPVGAGLHPEVERDPGGSPDFILPDVVYLIGVRAENGKGINVIERDKPGVYAMPVGMRLSKPKMNCSLPGSYVPYLHSLDLMKGRGDG